MDKIEYILKMNPEDQKKLFLQKLKEGDPEFPRILHRIVIEADNPETRYYAKKIIHHLRKKLAVKDEFSQSGVSPASDLNISTIIQALQSNDYRVKIRSLKGIQKYHLLEATQHILRILRSEKDPILLSYMIKVVGGLGDDKIIEEICPYIQHKNARVRANTVEALDQIGSPRSYPYIITALKDEDNRVRANAVKALQKVGRGNTLKLLKAMIYSKKISLVDSACYVLRYFDSPEVIELLKVALQYNSLSVTIKVREILTKLANSGNSEAAGMLDGLDIGFDDEAELLDFSDGEIDSDTNLALVFGEEELKMVVEPESLEDLGMESTEERIRTINELTDLGGSRILEMFKEEARTSTDPKLLATLVKSIGRLGSHKEIHFLEEFLNNKDGRVRANTIEGIKSIDVTSSIKEINRLMCEDSNNRVVANAILALADCEEINVLPSLRRLAAGEEHWSRKSAFFVIAETGLEEFYPLLEIILERAEDEFRAEILDFLNILKEKGSLIALNILKGQDLTPEEEEEIAALLSDETAPDDFVIITDEEPMGETTEEIWDEIIPESPKKSGSSQTGISDNPIFADAMERRQQQIPSIVIEGIDLLKNFRSKHVLMPLTDLEEDSRPDVKNQARLAVQRMETFFLRQNPTINIPADETLDFNEKSRFALLLEGLSHSFTDYMKAMENEIVFRNNRSVIRGLVRHLQSAPEKEVQNAFIGSCELISQLRRKKGRLDTTSDFLPLFLSPAFGNIAVERFRKLVWDNLVDSSVSGVAVLALGLQVTDAALTVLMEAYYDTSRSMHFRDISRAIGYHASAGSEMAFEFLTKSLHDDSTMRRQDAIHGLAVSGDIRVLELFTHAYDHNNLYMKESIDAGLNILIKNMTRMTLQLDSNIFGDNELIVSIFNKKLINNKAVLLVDQPDRIFDYIMKRLL